MKIKELNEHTGTYYHSFIHNSLALLAQFCKTDFHTGETYCSRAEKGLTCLPSHTQRGAAASLGGLSQPIM